MENGIPARATALIRLAFASALALMLAACGGGGSSSGGNITSSGGSGSSSPTPSPLVGVWTGNDVENGFSIPVEALIDASGDFDIIRTGCLTATFEPGCSSASPADEAQFAGTAAASGTSFPSSAFQGFEPTGGATFSDASTHGAGTVGGTVDAGSSISASYTFKTDGGTAFSGSMSLTYSAQTGDGSSLSAIGTNFTDPADTATSLSIDGTTGSVTGQVNILNATPAATCNVSGTVSILNASYDVYGITLTFAGCTGAYAGLEGATLKGFATLDSSVNPATLLVGVAGQSPGTTNNAFVFYGVQ